jgi:hypothetical protein
VGVSAVEAASAAGVASVMGCLGRCGQFGSVAWGKHTAVSAMMGAMWRRGCHIGDKCRRHAGARRCMAETVHSARGNAPD